MIYSKKGQFTVSINLFFGNKKSIPLSTREVVEGILQPLEFHHLDKTRSSHVTVEWIFKLLNKTEIILNAYGLSVPEYSEESICMCITEIIENVSIAPQTVTYYGVDLLYRGATVSCSKNEVRKFWKKYMTPERFSFNFLISCITEYRYEIVERRIDFDTAEHLLALYNILFYHLDTYRQNDEQFEIIVKNVCCLVHMFCIQYISFYPTYFREIKNGNYQHTT